MRKASVAALLPLLAGALSAQAQQRVSNGRQPGQGGQGITVKVLAPSPLLHVPLRYELSEPGYVAAFIVYPGAGVRLLYPTVDVPEKLQTAGYHSDYLIGVGFDNDIYNAVLGPIYAGPQYLYVVASKHPLDVARFVHRPMRLASAIGQKEAQSFYADVAFDALLNNAIALGDDASWDSDVYMLWPGTEETSGGRYVGDVGARWRDDLRYMTCTDGTLRLVPWNYPFIGCPGQSHVMLSRPALHSVQETQSLASAVVNPRAGEPPTVLPTIIGKRRTDAERSADMQRFGMEKRGELKPLPAGDHESFKLDPTYGTVVRLNTVNVTPRPDESTRRRTRDDLHSEYSPERRARDADAWRMREQEARLARDPQLSPNPGLSPNPELAPNPGMTSAARNDDRMAASVAQWQRDRETRASRPADESAQARQQFREARQEQAQERQAQLQARSEQAAPRPEPVRAAPPQAAPSPAAAAPSHTDTPMHGGRVVDK